MITKTYKVLLFVSSFLPLYVILIVKFYDFEQSIKENLLEHYVTFGFFMVLILISLLTFLYFCFCELNSEETFHGLENKNSEILSYFITYVVPLTTLEEGNLNSIIINALLFLVIGIFYVNSNLFYLNVLFTIFGFNVYQDSENKIIISRKSADKITNNTYINVKKVGKKIYIVNKK
ncbi:hypothetical protein [Paucisalibacillus globulus]|uniref:hypothetical protein n=1 Tax=Paucisalibacillus globulus TaxID=351095 RepID=UPI000BB71CF3|nr:hypothetical protein [Paucisalibacillus globulus]